MPLHLCGNELTILRRRYSLRYDLGKAVAQRISPAITVIAVGTHYLNDAGNLLTHRIRPAIPAEMINLNIGVMPRGGFGAAEAARRARTFGGFARAQIRVNG